MKKGLSKMLAVLLVAVLLCGILPAGACLTASAEGENLVVNGDFEAGKEGWSFNNSCDTVAAAAKDGSLGASIAGSKYNGISQVITVERNTDYELTFDQYSLETKLTVIYIKWGGSSGTQRDEWPTTTANEWKTLSFEFNSGDFDKMYIQFCVGNTTHYVDNVKVVKKATGDVEASNDGYIINGDFETGDNTGWSLSGTSSITADAAYGGSGYGLHVVGDGAWNDFGKTKAFAVEAGVEYELTFNAKITSGGMYVYFKNSNSIGGSLGDMIAGEYKAANNSWEQVTYSFIVSDGVEYMYLEFSGSGSGNVYFDNIKLTKKVQPSYDGYVYNGDFETGEASGWTLSGTSSISGTAAYEGSYGLHVTGDGGWNDYGKTNAFKVKPGAEYTLTYDAKVISGSMYVYFKKSNVNGDNKGDLISGKHHSADNKWTHYSETFAVSDDVEYVYLEFSGAGAGGEVYFDNVRVEKVGGEDPIPNTILTGGKTSVADVDSGNKALAFKFDVKATGAVVDNKYVYQSGSATVTPFADREGDYPLVRAGALVTNDASVGGDAKTFTAASVDDKRVLDIEAVYLFETGADTFSFAVRIVNLPDIALSVNIYARPYYVYEVEGEEVTVYGAIKSDNYTHASTPKSSIKVLAIGNSFSHDAMYNHLYKVLKSAGYEEIVLGNLYIGGCSLDTHWTNMNNNKGSYKYYKNSNGTWKTTESYKISTALAEEEWDYITIQQVSGSSGLPGTYGNLNNILNYINKNKTNPNARILWHMTWAYDEVNSNDSYANYGNNQMTMYNAIVETTQNKILGNSLIDGIIPSGTAIQNMRTSSLKDSQLCEGDGYHLSTDYGDYIASLTWYAFISGDDVAQLEYQTTAIARYRDAANKAVMSAIQKPFEITDCSD